MTGSTGYAPAASAGAAGDFVGRMSGSGSPNVAGVRTGLTCQATADAAKAASNLYFANRQTYRSVWSDLTTAKPPMVQLPRGVAINARNAKELDGPAWNLVLTGGDTGSPSFTCR